MVTYSPIPCASGEVPNVLGLPVARARQVLDEAGFKKAEAVGRQPSPSDTVVAVVPLPCRDIVSTDTVLSYQATKSGRLHD
jgi:beta-lactam-binding protein with PASTA domain